GRGAARGGGAVAGVVEGARDGGVAVGGGDEAPPVGRLLVVLPGDAQAARAPRGDLVEVDVGGECSEALLVGFGAPARECDPHGSPPIRPPLLEVDRAGGRGAGGLVLLAAVSQRQRHSSPPRASALGGAAQLAGIVTVHEVTDTSAPAEMVVVLSTICVPDVPTLSFSHTV